MLAYQTAIFDKLGLKIGQPKGSELPALCPFHNDRHMGNFFINLKSGLFHCFSCGAKGIIYELPLNGVGIEEFRKVWNAIKQPDELINYKLNDDLIRYYKNFPPSNYSLKRGINLETICQYGVVNDCNGNPIFFVRNWQGEYKAVWIRTPEGYFLLEPLDSKANGDLFGLHLPPTEKYVLTEGFFDAMSVYQDTGYKSVCGNGVFLTEKQIENLKKLQPLYIMLDGDAAGRRGRNRLFEQLLDIDVYFCGKYKGDPDQLTKEQKLHIIECAKSRTEYYEVYAKNNS